MPPRSSGSVAIWPKASVSAPLTSWRSVAASSGLSRPCSVTYRNVRKGRICWWESMTKTPCGLDRSWTRTSRTGGPRANQFQTPMRILVSLICPGVAGPAVAAADRDADEDDEHPADNLGGYVVGQDGGAEDDGHNRQQVGGHRGGSAFVGDEPRVEDVGDNGS